MRQLPVLLAVMLLAPAALWAEPRSAILTFPPGAATKESLYKAGTELLRRTGYELNESVPEKKIRASVTYYDSNSPFHTGVTPSTLSWVLEIKAEEDGRIVVTLRHEAQGGRPLEDVPLFAQNLAVGAGARSAKALLTYHGETKPLLEWKQSSAH
jgi:hypothetical protein